MPLGSAPIPVPATAPATTALSMAPLPLPPWFAMVQAFLVCGIPTQLMVAVVLVLFVGMRPFDSDGISSSSRDAQPARHGPRHADDPHVSLPQRRGDARRLHRDPAGQGAILRGLLLLPVVFVAVTAIVLGLRALFPGLHTVQENPYMSFMRSPLESTIFIVVVVLAGGIREEVQRAFILHRFEQRLGGVYVGLVLFSLAFGAFHINEGLDASVAVGLLGLLWGLIYIKRRSAVMGMVNHASFDVAQILQIVIARSFGL
jgi:membrane protease YdiL (CAAX protease family)